MPNCTRSPAPLVWRRIEAGVYETVARGSTWRVVQVGADRRWEWVRLGLRLTRSDRQYVTCGQAKAALLEHLQEGRKA